MKRREFVGLVGGAAAAWPLAARGQQPALPVVGLLDGIDDIPAVAGFRQGLSQSGFIEGKNVTFEHRSASGRYDRLPALAAELVRRQVAVLAAYTSVAALAAKAATTTIPIVFSLGSDPVKDGLVTSLNRPGGNITGVTFFTNVLAAKRLELLHEIIPKAPTLAVLVNPNNANAELELNETEVAARTLGLQLIVVRASNEREIDAAFATLVQQRVTALHLAGDAYFFSRSGQIVALATRHGMATSQGSRDFVAAGGLMSYGANRLNSSRQAGIYVARILKGEKPADLPVMQPTKFDLVLNLNAAKALGIEIPAKVLALADEVIE